MIRNSCFILLMLLACTSCTVVKEYQKVHLNDTGMQLNNRPIEEFDSNFESYREGAVGGNNGNNGGGCGCN